MWRMQGSFLLLCNLMCSYVFIDIFPPGRWFSFENIEFSFLVFLRGLRGGLGHDFALHPGSPVLLGTLSCFSRALLASILGVLVPQSCLKSESCWIWRTLTKHAPACTDRTSRPLPWSTEIGQKARSIKNTPKLHRPRSRGALLVPRRASGVLQRACEEAEWAPEAPPEEYSGTLAVPKCPRTHTVDGIPA